MVCLLLQKEWVLSSPTFFFISFWAAVTLDEGFLSSASLSDSVSMYFLDLMLELKPPFRIVLAVADFLGTTLGFGGGMGAFFGKVFFLAGVMSDSDSSFEIGLGGALLLVTNPDFFMEPFFLFFSADESSFSFGLLTGLGCKMNKHS